MSAHSGRYLLEPPSCYQDLPLKNKETKNCTINSIAGAIGPLFPDKSIPGSKIDGELADGSVDTNELADKSVTAIKLANQSSGIYGVRPAAGEYTGQICADSNLLYMWDGSTWAEIDGPNSIITITYGGGPVELVSVNKSNGEAEITTAFVDSTDARQFSKCCNAWIRRSS